MSRATCADSGLNLQLMKYIARLVFVAASLLSLGVSAQWQWVDIDGRKVFSDRAPPASVPDKSILKRPGQARATTPITVSSEDSPKDIPQASASAPAQAGASTPKPTALDKELADRKKKAEQAEAAKRKIEDDRVAKAKSENCERARSAKAGLDSGIRMARINKQGEREILDDATRAAEAKRIQAVVDSDCK